MSPRDNPDLFGHARAEQALLDAMAAGRLHHAWIFAGPEGVGKATLAYRFARALFSPGGATLARPADSPVFRRVASGGHADLLTIERDWDEKKRRLKRVIAAERAREIAPFLRLTPAEGGWRVVVVDGAEDLNPQSANALLKILEEPPSRAVLILVCETPGRLLPTLRSRCRILRLAPLDDAAMGQALDRLLADRPPATRARLAALAGGAPGRAVALAQGGEAVAALVDEVLAALPGLKPGRYWSVADKLREEEDFELFFDLLGASIAGAVGRSLRGLATGAEARLASLRPAAEWSRIVADLARLSNETSRFSLDRRATVVEGLAML